MSNGYTLPEAARRLGCNVRTLRAAIREGKIPGPKTVDALTTLSSDWLLSAEAAVAGSPKVLGAAKQSVPPFARYEGTSAFRKYPVRVREFNAFKAKAAQAAG